MCTFRSKTDHVFLLFSCTEGFLGVNLEGYRQTSNVDEKFCGKLWPPELTSKDPRMILTFDTHNATTARFVASYRFLSGLSSSFLVLDSTTVFEVTLLFCFRFRFVLNRRLN